MDGFCRPWYLKLMGDRDDITQLLLDWNGGDQRAGDQLMRAVHAELETIAGRLFRRERAGHTLQPTALINEAYERLVRIDVSWQDRAHFYALATRMMRRLLINHAAARQAQKREGNAVRVTLDESVLGEESSDFLMIDLGRAIERLSEQDERKAQLIELHYFGGLTQLEMVEVTGLSESTIRRDLRFARAWLKGQLTGES